MNKAKTLFYFGYGSNMSTQYLIKRRKIIPFSSNAGVLKDYKLIMNMGGPNFLEPSFANIRAIRGLNVEGVVHEIDKKRKRLEAEKKDLEGALGDAETALEFEENKLLKLTLDINQLKTDIDKVYINYLIW